MLRKTCEMRHIPGQHWDHSLNKINWCRSLWRHTVQRWAFFYEIRNVCDMDAYTEVAVFPSLHGQGVVQISRCHGINCEDALFAKVPPANGSLGFVHNSKSSLEWIALTDEKLPLLEWRMAWREDNHSHLRRTHHNRCPSRWGSSRSSLSRRRSHPSISTILLAPCSPAGFSNVCPL